LGLLGASWRALGAILTSNIGPEGSPGAGLEAILAPRANKTEKLTKRQQKHHLYGSIGGKILDKNQIENHLKINIKK